MKTVILITLLIITHATHAAAPVTLTPAQIEALGIETVTIETTGTRFSGQLPGKVTVPNSQLQVVTAPQQGLVEALLVAEGDSVRRGQPLLRIQSPSLLALKGEYLEIHTRYKLAETNYRRDRQLNREGIIAERRLLESRARYRELGASLARVSGLLQLAGMDDRALEELAAERNLSSVLVVPAPFDGVILEQLVVAGSRVDAADPLYRIGRLKPLWLEVHVPLEQLGDTAPGQQVVVPALGLGGQVVTVGRTVHTSDQGVLVRAEVHEGVERLRPGQFVQVQLAVRTGSGSFRVPRAAIARSGGNSWIFLAVPAGFAPVPVTITDEEADHLIIAAELPRNATIARSGVAALKAAWLEAGD